MYGPSPTTHPLTVVGDDHWKHRPGGWLTNSEIRLFRRVGVWAECLAVLPRIVRSLPEALQRTDEWRAANLACAINDQWDEGPVPAPKSETPYTTFTAHWLQANPVPRWLTRRLLAQAAQWDEELATCR